MTLFGDDKPTRQPAKTAPAWSAVAGRTPCDKCVAEALAARQRGDVQLTPNPARWRRVHEGSDARLCYPHAQPIRADDDTARTDNTPAPKRVASSAAAWNTREDATWLDRM